MEKVFLELLNVSITASWVTLAVLVLRLFLKKAPKWLSCVLWGLVGLRLVLPFSFESSLSLIPSTQTLPGNIVENPQLNSGIAAVDKAVNPVIVQQLEPLGPAPLQTALTVCAIAWLVGMGLMVLYGIFTSARLYRSVRTAMPVAGNIYCGDDIDTPFILGVFMPRIFLPSGLDPAQTQAVIAHEEAHLRRRDHLWKPIGFALLALYWYNPFLWVAYILLCRDIELACDETVIKAMEAAEKKQYSQALAACANGHRMVLTCPLAFGEVGVKERIQAVLMYKKPAFWLVIAGGVCVAVAAVSLLTDAQPCTHTYESTVTLDASCTRAGEETFTCTGCGHRYTSEMPLLSHTYDAGTVTQKPTCTQVGVTEYSCIHCGEAKTEPIPTEAHTFSSIYVDKEPNCTQEGEEAGWCLGCEQEYVVRTLPTNDVHDMVTQVIAAATCTQAGQGQKVCSRCGLTEEITYEKLDHSYKDGMVLPATCTKEGEKQQTCQACGKERWVSVPIDPDAHWWIYNGIAGYYECVYCPERKDDD